MTNRYSRTGTALEDGISGTRVMQPANNAIIQTPALPRLSRSNCSADKKSPSGNPAPTPAGTFHASAGVSTGKNKPGGLKRGRSFPKASSAGKSVPNSLGKGRFTVLWNRKTWKPAKRNYPSQQPARTRRQPSGRKRRLRRRKECSLPASASSLHRRTSARSAPQTEPGQMPHSSSREGCLLGYRSDLIITGCGNGSGCITERSKGMYFIAPF